MGFLFIKVRAMNRFVRAGQAALLSIMVVGVSAFAADATLNQVYEAVHAGRLNQAQGMMTEVLRDHPNSAKAHYVEAEILAKQGHGAEAQGELTRAEQLAPGLPFVSQASVQELRGVIASEGARQAPIIANLKPVPVPQAHESTFPWGVVLIVVAGALIAYAFVRARRNAAVAPYTGGTTGVPGAAPMGTPPMAPMGGGIGSGIVGGLVTGAAVGAGVVAGEALAHDLLGGHASSGAAPVSDRPAPAADDDLGGQDFGIGGGGSWDDGGGGLDGGGSWD